MKGAVRVSDLGFVTGDAHSCPACAHVCVGPVISGSGDVFVNGLNAARKGDPGVHAVCCGPNTFNTNEGSDNVFVNGKPFVRRGDATKHCGGDGKIITASANVNVN